MFLQWEIEYQALLKISVLESLSSTEMYKRMVKVLLLRSLLHRWALKFQHDRVKLGGELCGGRTKIGIIPEIVEQAQDMFVEMQI